jgi:sphingolipid delta-4 desaturase
LAREGHTKTVAATDFQKYTYEQIPHHQRAPIILKAHPDIRELLGTKNPWTFAIILGCVALQVVMAWHLKDAPTWQILACAYLVGAYASHSLFVCIHEAGHNLIFRTTNANLAAGLVANLPTIFPTALPFRLYHSKHHSFLGVEEHDADIPSKWEAKLIGSYSLGKFFWLSMFPIFQALRTPRIQDSRKFDRRIKINWAVQIVFTALIYALMGPKAIGYLIASFWFSVGPHPLGARWVQEHWLVLDDHQETYSYYGPMNIINLNIGYHNEHHDFPSVPWNLLPEVKRRAPEFYENLNVHGSLTGLFFRFLFDQEISLYSRIVRRLKYKQYN